MPVLTDGFGGVGGAGLRWPKIPTANSGRLVFFSSPLDAVPMSSSTDDRVQLLRQRNALPRAGRGQRGRPDAGQHGLHDSRAW